MARTAELRVLNEVFVPDARKGAIRGQVDGLERMLDAKWACVEILT